MTSFESFIRELEDSPEYQGQIVHIRRVEPRDARYGELGRPFPAPIERVLEDRGIERLYSHQALATNMARDGQDVLITTGTASGKTLCYALPILETLLQGRRARSLLLFPTKALTQDQFRGFSRAMESAKIDESLAGVYDGDTPSSLRKKLRTNASAIFSNPDMLHASIMPQHGRWAEFIANLEYLVLDEIHVYNGIFGSNMANLMHRFWRICERYGSDPQIIACSATIANPAELAERLTGREMEVISEDGSPRGGRTYLFWNPPTVRERDWRSRRSANVEAHDLMVRLVQQGIPTIVFSKARVTAEMIYRYVRDKLREETPQLAGKICPYRGGYLPEERREIERRLFEGELMGVSTTPALELGIDVGVLDASVVVGYPGTLASFFQQAGRAGREERDALVILIGIDTATNQYVMTEPDYIFGRPIEAAVLEPENPFVTLGHLRCASHELPLSDEEADSFGPDSDLVLSVLEENHKIHRIDDKWYHSASEIPHHELALRYAYGETVMIEDEETGEVIEEVDKADAPPLVHPDAIYLHNGETWRVLDLDMERNIATVRRVDVDYYTQPLGGADVHHIDLKLREKPFGTGVAHWGEVTAYDRTVGYEKIHFYELDAISRHGLNLPPLTLETMAFWIEPPEPLLARVRNAGLNTHSGLRGIGYATRMLLPLFITCNTLDFSHTIGSANSPWQSIFVYELYTHGLGFTEKAYERLGEIMPAVLEHIKSCDCEDGCPACVGKPLRQFASWNVERHEGAVPSRESAIMILEGLLGDRSALDCPDRTNLADRTDGEKARLRKALRRRLERMREPRLLHRIEPTPPEGYPEPIEEEVLDRPDVAQRRRSRRDFHKKLRQRLEQNIPDERLSPETGKNGAPQGMKRGRGSRKPIDFPGAPLVRDTGAADIRGRYEPQETQSAPEEASVEGEKPTNNEEKATGEQPRSLGDSIASRARKLKKKRSGNE
ncbi:MAG: DEAD/DEAH box helicase [Planctomycetes bacterium]|nr:DEAD/DEAH box helicase [Planctomycetota bacterium]